jgi:hypothetical protein
MTSLSLPVSFTAISTFRDVIKIDPFWLCGRKSESVSLRVSPDDALLPLYAKKAPVIGVIEDNKPSSTTLAAEPVVH